MDSARTGYGLAALSLAFVTGSLLGVTLGRLFAPRRGAETRKKIKEGAEEARERMREATRIIRERAEELSETGRERISEAGEKVQELTDKIKERVFPKKEEDTTET